MMKRRTLYGALAVGVALLCVIIYFVVSSSTKQAASLRVGIAPYQDIAMLTTYKEAGLDKKYNISLELITLPWEEIIPSLASAGKTIDVGFGSLIEFLTKYQNLNAGASDPLVYVYPAYVFKGGGFVSFKPKVPNLDESATPSSAQVKDFLSFKIGAQRNSMFDMLLFSVAARAGIDRGGISTIDTPLADGLLAAQAGSIDIAAAGLTQRNEALQRGGRVVLTLEKHGFADLTGFIARKSTVEKRGNELRALIQVWFGAVDFVYSDMDRNSRIPLEFLAKSSSTQYTLATYKQALEAEYLPRTLQDAQRDIIADNGQFSISRISTEVSKYLLSLGIVRAAPPVPKPITVP